MGTPMGYLVGIIHVHIVVVLLFKTSLGSLLRVPRTRRCVAEKELTAILLNIPRL